MQTLNQKGQVVILFALLIPFFVLLLVLTVQFSEIVFAKIKLQATLDRAVFAGASYLTETLNQIALSNRKVHQEFLNLKKRFKEGMKQNTPAAKKEIEKTWKIQNQIFDDEMLPQVQEARAKAWTITSQIVQKEFPQARLIPLSDTPLRIGEGITEEFSFAEIKGVTFDPKGYRRVPKNGFEARVAFVKDFETPVVLSAGVEWKGWFKTPFQAISAAQPYGGSLWRYALEGSENFFYRTARVPLR